MKNFQPGGLRNRKPDLGGRPHSDTDNYAPKKRFDAGNRPSFGKKPVFSSDRTKKDMTLYSASCTTCGKSCEVPFRPDGVKPVLCRDCFAAKNESPGMNNSSHGRYNPAERAPRSFDRPAIVRPQMSPDYQKLANQMTELEVKVIKIMEYIESIKNPQQSETLQVSTIDTKVLTRKPRKLSSAIKKAAVKKKATVAKKVAKKTVKKSLK